MTQEEVTYLTKKEADSLIKSIDNPRNLALINLLLKAGLFVKELIHLKATDINWPKSQIEIPGNRKRSIKINDPTFDSLAIWTRRRKKSTSPYLFTPFKTKSEKLGLRSIDSIIRKHSQKAGLEKNVNAKLLRTTFAFNLCSQDITTNQAKRILGITDTESVRRYFPKRQPKI